ncbi:MAG: hypothetical protein ACTS3T_13565 [Almyronema sp.]
MIDALTLTIDDQTIVLNLHDLNSANLEAAIARLGDHFSAALAAEASLSLQSTTGKVDFSKLQQWLSDRSFEPGQTELLNDLLSQILVDISAFSIAANGGFTIAFQASFADAIETQNLSAELSQIIAASEVGLGLCYHPTA